MNFDGLYRASRKIKYFRGRDRLISLIASQMRPGVRELPFGFSMHLNPKEWAQLTLIEEGCTEPITTQLFESLITKGDTIIDVGAHVGFYSLLAGKQAGGTGTVIGIEPQPANCAQALNNIQINKMETVSIVCAAIGRQEEWVDLKLQASSDTSRLSLVGDGVNDLNTTFHVPVCRLDTLARRHQIGRIKLLKIDVEEFEFEVLEGCGELLSKIENIILELLPVTPNHRKQKILDLLVSNDFELKQVNGLPFSSEQPLPEHNLWAKRRG